MKKFAVASLVAALSLTMLAGGASAFESNLGTVTTKDQMVKTSSWNTEYIALKVGYDKQLDNYSGSVTFKYFNIFHDPKYSDLVVLLTPNGYVRGLMAGHSRVAAYDQNGNIVKVYDITVWGS